MNDILDEGEEHQYKPEGSPDLIPYMVVGDMDKSIHFYRKAFQFELVHKPIEVEGSMVHATMKHNDARISLYPEGAFGRTQQTPKDLEVKSPVALILYVKDVEEFYKQALNEGAISVREPFSLNESDRVAQLVDINGYNWSIITRVPRLEKQKDLSSKDEES